MPAKDPKLPIKLGLVLENLQNLMKDLSFEEVLAITAPFRDKHKVLIPLDVLKNRDLGVLESLTIYLKDEKGMKFSEIAKALERDDRTIWATYHKAKKKLEK